VPAERLVHSLRPPGSGHGAREERVEAVIIPAATFRSWIAEHESLRRFVFQMFSSSRLTEVMSLVEEVAFRRMDQRLARRLAGCS